MTGRYLFPPSQILDIILNGKEAAAMNIDASVVWNLRIPRILLNILVGGGLAIADTVFQGSFRNPLVSPDILGVSSGAAFVAALGILISGINIHATVFALVFSVISVCLTYSLARLRNEITPRSLVLSGMIISAIFSALISLTKYIADPYDKLPAITYWLMGRSRHIGTFSIPNDKDYEIVANVLEKVGISSLASKKVTNISGGQLQLVLIARALASDPQLLVMDEPESYLEFKNQYTMLSMIRTTVSDTKLACIMNTHYPAHALQISDKTLMMKPRNHIFGSTKDIVTKHNLNDYFEVQSKIITDNENNIPYSAFVVLGTHK